ncbi:MAG: phytoene desaturase family protein [Bacteroidales bacterium]
MSKKVIVIGAGFSGLSSAAVLAKSGFEVKVFEKNSLPGGRARKLQEEGFMFDMGPSWYWLPDVFERFFNLFDKSSSDFYKLERLDPSYRVFYSENEIIDIPAGRKNVIALFESMEKGSGRKLERFLDEAEYKYRVGVNQLVYKPARSVFEFMQWDVFKGLFRLDLLKSFHKYVRQNFKDPRLWPLLEFPVIFLGATPKRTPALYSLMNHADMGLGTWYPMGGMFEVVRGFETLAKSYGVEFHYDSPVEKIVTAGNRTTGVKVNGLFYEADYIIGSADYHHIEQSLLPEDKIRYSEKYWESREMAPSSLMFYLGLDRKFRKLIHHNLMFDKDFEVHATELFEKQQWPSQPLLYTSVTSKTDMSVAPENKENLVVLIPVAPGLEDNESIRGKYFDLVMDRIELLTGESVRDHVIYRKSYAHNDFAADYNAYKGNAYGLGNTLMQTAIFKPKLYPGKLKNMVFAGQLTTPGPGVPPTIISGQVAAGEIIKMAGK